MLRHNTLPGGDPPDDEPAPRPERKSLAGLLLSIVIVFAVFAAMAALFFAARQKHDAPVPFTGVEFDSAEKRWQSDAALRHYTLVLELSGSRSGQITLDVNEHFPPQADPTAAPGTSIGRVEDMFQIIRDDLAIVNDPDRVMPPGMAGTEREPLRARFDATTGVPIAYDRPLLENRPAFGWRVVSFTPGK